MTEKKRYNPPLHVDMDFGEALERFAQTDPKELDMKSNEIKSLPAKMPSKELDPDQGVLDLGIDRQAEVDGIGMV